MNFRSINQLLVVVNLINASLARDDNKMIDYEAAMNRFQSVDSDAATQAGRAAPLIAACKGRATTSSACLARIGNLEAQSAALTDQRNALLDEIRVMDQHGSKADFDAAFARASAAAERVQALSSQAPGDASACN